MQKSRRNLILGAGAAAVVPQHAFAQNKYDQGASDSEILIGQTMPYSGPASAYGTQGKAEVAYFKMLNSKGGINGRKITLLSMDDGYSPPKTVEVTRKLVEETGVLFLANSIGTPTNISVHKYLNSKKVPQLLVSTGALRWNDPKGMPWTTPGFPPYGMEGRVYAKHLLANKADSKIAILYQNDDAGRDYVKGFKEGLGANVKQVIKEASYEVTDPSVDSQVIELRSSGADAWFLMGTPKFAAMALRKAGTSGWKPQIYLVSVASSPAQVLEPAGVENAAGCITASTLKIPGDPEWNDDQGMKDYLTFIKEWYPEANAMDTGNFQGYFVAKVIEHIVRSAGNDLTRANIMKQATSLSGYTNPALLPGVTLDMTATDWSTWHVFQTMRFDGKRWVRFGTPISVADL